MKIKNKIVLTIVGLLLFATAGYSQNKFDVNAQAKSMHYWRGLRVTEGVMTGTSVGYFGENFSTYAWGGLSVDGSYKEVTNCFSYSKNNFRVTLLDIFNFSGVQDVEYFNYNKDETVHFLDLSVGYSFSFMNVSWATVIYGNDLLANGDQRYSTYVQVEFPIKVKDVTVTPFIAPAFALNSEAETMLYGDDSFGIANMGLSVGKTLKFAEKEFPVSATLGYNTILKEASVQLAVNLF